MKKYIISLILISSFCRGFSQIVQDTTIKLDLLKAPSSAGANLLGFANSDIDKPSDISAFMVSLQSATASLSRLPTNYAIDIAPYWLFSKRTDFTTAGLSSKIKGDIFKQTFALSFAIRNPDSTNKDFNINNTYGAIGFKFSLLRGEYNDKTKISLNEIGSIQKRINHKTMNELQNFIKSDTVLKRMSAEREQMLIKKFGGDDEQAKKDSTYYLIDSLINKLQAKILKNSPLDDLAEIQEKASTLKLNRIGWSWDVAGGVSGEFINKRFDNAKVFNAGLWTTIGYTGKAGGSLLLLIRYLYNPNKIFALDDAINKKTDNISTLDIGGRYVYSNVNSKFTCSVETIYRSVLLPSTIPSSWRLILNTDYAIWENQKLTFSFGRNFDGLTSKDGNLVAALGILVGLGNNR